MNTVVSFYHSSKRYISSLSLTSFILGVTGKNASDQEWSESEKIEWDDSNKRSSSKLNDLQQILHWIESESTLLYTLLSLQRWWFSVIIQKWML